MSNLARYGQSAQDKTYPDSDESVFGHMVLEMGMSPDEAVRNLRPWVRDLDRSAANSKNTAYITAFIGAGAGLATAATMGIGLTAILPIAAAAYNFVVGQQSAREQGIRESEYLLLKTCPELLKLIYALTKKGMPKEALVECYDDLLGAFTVQFQSRAQLGLSDELDHDIIRSFQRTVEEKCSSESLARSIVAETESFVFDTLYQSTAPDTLPVATSSPIGNNKRLGAALVPASPTDAPRYPQESQEWQRPTDRATSKNGVEFFDFNLLREKPDNFTAFAIVADPGGGKTRLIKYLTRNILLGGTTSVMDIYARKSDWLGSKVIKNVSDFINYMKQDLSNIEELIADYSDGRSAFAPDLFVLEEAADTLSETKEDSAASSKLLKLWLSKYLTVTRKISKRLCLVSCNIADITSAIESAEKRNSVVFIFPGSNGVAKAMGDSYIFKLGTNENFQLREKLSKAIDGLERPALIHHRGQWWAAEIPFVNEDGTLADGSSPAIEFSKIKVEPQRNSAEITQNPVSEETEAFGESKVLRETPAQAAKRTSEYTTLLEATMKEFADYVRDPANHTDNSGAVKIRDFVQKVSDPYRREMREKAADWLLFSYHDSFVSCNEQINGKLSRRIKAIS